MNEWINLGPKIILYAPNIVQAFGKDWIYSEIKVANQNSTEPAGTTPLVAVLLKMAKADNIDALKHFDSVIKSAVDQSSKRLKELSDKSGLADGSAWQGLAELSFLEKLPKEFLNYDDTADSIRTPDFIIHFDGEQVGIEHVAPSEGQLPKTNQKNSKEELDRARRISNLLDHAKNLFIQSGQLPPITSNERVDIARAYGKEKKLGNSDPTVSDEELLQIIKTHEIEEIRAFSTMYVSTRMRSRAELIRYLTQCKLGGAQVMNCKWKILALSLADTHFCEKEIEELLVFKNANDPANSRWWSGSVWHAMYGEPKKLLYCGTEESLALKKVRTLNEDCLGYGMLNDPMEPWHAVVVSFFKSSNYNLDSPNSTREGSDLIPTDLRASRYLFLNRKNISIPKDIINSLVSTLEINKVIK